MSGAKSTSSSSSGDVAELIKCADVAIDAYSAFLSYFPNSQSTSLLSKFLKKGKPEITHDGNVDGDSDGDSDELSVSNVLS